MEKSGILYKTTKKTNGAFIKNQQCEIKGKRETGENPVRSRHCKQKTYTIKLYALATETCFGKADMRKKSVSQETCRLWYRNNFGSRGIDR